MLYQYVASVVDCCTMVTRCGGSASASAAQALVEYTMVFPLWYQYGASMVDFGAMVTRCGGGGGLVQPSGLRHQLTCLSISCRSHWWSIHHSGYCVIYWWNIGGWFWCIGDRLVLDYCWCNVVASRHQLTCLKSAAAASSWQWPLLVLASKI